MPRVTVVMAVFNAEQFLREAVESILSQHYRDFELVAVEDKSCDRSLAILQGFKDDRLRIIAHRENKGAAVSRNDGMMSARGEYIAIMDADDIARPDRLARQVAFLEDHPAVGLVGCGTFDNIDVDGQVLYTTSLPKDNDAIQEALVERWCFVHPSIMFRKRLFDRVGGYRSQFEPAEDHDFILRILEECEAHNLDEKLLDYRINPGGLSVVGHDYINQLGVVAMSLARARRAGRPEDLGEVQALVELKQKRKAAGALTKWFYRRKESLYAANRYYGFGCRELYAGRRQQASRCFVRSIKTNWLFPKSWVCLGISLSPLPLSKVRGLFRTSKLHYDELEKVQAQRRLSLEGMK